MAVDKPDHHRRSIRLSDFDHASAGGYFVTLCTHEKKCVLGDIRGSEMHLSDLGRIVDLEWRRSSEIRVEVELDSFVIMPNHMHAIVLFRAELPDAAEPALPRTMRGTGRRTLSSLVAGFKAATTRRTRAMIGPSFDPLWQRNYYEHVIRGERVLDRIRQYIADNPLRWNQDGYHPSKS